MCVPVKLMSSSFTRVCRISYSFAYVVEYANSDNDKMMMMMMKLVAIVMVIMMMTCSYACVEA